MRSYDFPQVEKVTKTFFKCLLDSCQHNMKIVLRALIKKYRATMGTLASKLLFFPLLSKTKTIEPEKCQDPSISTRAICHENLRPGPPLNNGST